MCMRPYSTRAHISYNALMSVNNLTYYIDDEQKQLYALLLEYLQNDMIENAQEIIKQIRVRYGFYRGYQELQDLHTFCKKNPISKEDIRNEVNKCFQGNQIDPES